MNGFRVVVFRSFVLSTLTLLFNSLLSSPSCADGLTAGDQVRVKYSGGEIEGKLLSSNANVIVIDAAGSGHMSVEQNSIDHLERLDGTHRHWGTGLLVGAGAGMFVGGILEAQPDDPNELHMDGAVFAGYTVLGAVTGALVGMLIKTDRWTSMDLDGAKVGVAPYHEGAALSLAWSF